MQFKKTLAVERHVADEMNRICQELDDSVTDGTAFDEEVVFDDGNRVAIQVCGGGGDSTCWTQGVLFAPDGEELAFTDALPTFTGQEYVVEYDGDEYIVEVVVLPKGAA